MVILNASNVSLFIGYQPVTPSPPSETLIVTYVFAVTVVVTVVVYLLRGFGLLTFLPGAVLWVLILLSIATGLVYGVQKTRRY